MYHEYFFWGETPTWDAFFPTINDAESRYKQAIYAGEFDADLFAFESELSRGNLSTEYKLSKRRALAAASSDSTPDFIYSHSNLPGHTQNSGVCQDGEVDNWKSKKLPKANEEMKEDLTVLAPNLENSIVIITGDHGPYLTKNCTVLHEWNPMEVDRLDIQDRNGTFLAIHWPERYQNSDQIDVVQQLFPTILKQLSPNNAEILEANRLSIFDARSGQIAPNVYIQGGEIIGGLNDGEILFEKAR
jgi:hypothetical protein